MMQHECKNCGQRWMLSPSSKREACQCGASFSDGTISGPPRGLGDTVERVIKTVTLGLVKPCGGCKKRREALNALVPYAATPKPTDNLPPNP